MRDAEPVGDRARIADVVAGAAGALAPGRGAMVVKLEGDADDFGAAGRRQRRDDRTVDPARHGDDNPPRAERRWQLEQPGEVERFENR